ncbi:LacI family DNA-binding transcriptional regulator [Promicromonospora sp. Populi]|uniref:LacI family DNA-binding transcriptional regulator n=1 Tax=Promicromonospora sp. Populi TaxID=3239420 RepID=UPI0034E24642
MDDDRDVERVSLRAVAAAAGVSPSTVSRFLRGTLTLRGETLVAVERAIRRLGYVAPLRGPARRTGLVGVVVPDLANAYYGTIAETVSASLRAQGRTALIVSARGATPADADAVARLLALAPDGVLYLAERRRDPAVHRIAEARIPLVLVDEAVDGAGDAPRIAVADYSGGWQAVKHLVSLGHRRIAVATGPEDLSSVRERRRGWHDALLGAGLDPDAQLRYSGRYTEAFGYEVLSSIMSVDAAERPTAVFIGADEVALGALTAARELGVHVPRDISVVSFDDVPAAAGTSPPLTTVRTPRGQLAERSVEVLMALLDGAPDEAAPSETLSVQLVVRESSGPPPR